MPRSQKSLENRRAYARSYYAANRDKIRTRNRAWRERNPQSVKPRDEFLAGLWYRHGLRPEDWMELWNAQDGRCYLCGDEMEQPLRKAGKGSASTVAIDHDHSHCLQGKSCRICRRGLAHKWCNSAIGILSDDPARLRRAADALEAAQAAVQNRKQEAPAMVPLF